MWKHEREFVCLRDPSERVRIRGWVFCMHVWMLAFISVCKTTVNWSRKSTLWLEGAFHWQCTLDTLSTLHLLLSSSLHLILALTLADDSLWTQVKYGYNLWLDRPLKHVAGMNSFLLKGPLQFVCSKWKSQKEYFMAESVTRIQAGLSVGSSQAHTNKYHVFVFVVVVVFWHLQW